MAFDFERREIRLLQGTSKKVPVSHTLSESMIKSIDEVATENLLSRSEAIEIAIFRFMNGYKQKIKKIKGEELMRKDMSEENSGAV